MLKPTGNKLSVILEFIMYNHLTT